MFGDQLEGDQMRRLAGSSRISEWNGRDTTLKIAIERDPDKFE